ncbi:hypothetical protein SAMN05661091_1467 [Paenibacillus uliginis N3/975]|uniref:Replication restart DNA helicase PriA n=1 Tax=Paenibacillus uliginis N3/975 TaxID=1313296 RepID=A0A1X7H0E7_9BACL|nr:hypothetical protein [Paenibacillus uliginis]SMF77673.1 hypothetical protein SAMN05661091_1467 [Paenibacillus uliginis N3/975]
MQRFVDELGYPYSFCYVLHQGGQVAVKCPDCRGLAYIYGTECLKEVRCTNCFYHEKEKEQFRHTASGVCGTCERWFNEELHDDKQLAHKHIHIPCPHCGAFNQVAVEQKTGSRVYRTDIQDGKDPVFHLELYYLDYLRGKPVWAVNRDHLNYLLSYLSATLREKPVGAMKWTASYSVPKYMKEAKNRDAVVKILRKLQQKAPVKTQDG